MAEMFSPNRRLVGAAGISRSPGVTGVASHLVEPHPDGTRLTLALDISGPLGGVGWLFTKKLAKQYVETEADTIRKFAERG